MVILDIDIGINIGIENCNTDASTVNSVHPCLSWSTSVWQTWKNGQRSDRLFRIFLGFTRIMNQQKQNKKTKTKNMKVELGCFYFPFLKEGGFPENYGTKKKKKYMFSCNYDKNSLYCSVLPQFKLTSVFVEIGHLRKCCSQIFELTIHSDSLLMYQFEKL